MIAACRDPSSAENLRQLGESSGNEERLDVVKLDVTDQASVERVAEHAKDKHRVSKGYQRGSPHKSGCWDSIAFVNIALRRSTTHVQCYAIPCLVLLRVELMQ